MATILVLALVLAVGVAAVAVRAHEFVAGIPLAVLMLLAAGWCATYAGTFVLADPLARLRVSYLSFVAIAYIPVAWLVFAVNYTGRGPRVSPQIVVALLIVPTVTATLAVVGHPLLLAPTTTVVDVPPTLARGPWFWVHAAYSYALLAAGTALLAMLFVVPNERSADAVVVLGAAAIPWLANAVHLSGLVSFPLDPTPFAFVVTGVLLTASITEWGVFDTLPVAREVARDAVIEEMDDGIVVLSEDDRVLDVNPAAAQVLGGVRLGESVDAVDGLDGAANDLPTEVELDRDGETRRYELRESSFEHLRGLVAGRLITVHDITHAYRHQQRLAVLNRVLRHDLRNDLNVVQGHAALLEADTVEVADSASVINEKATRLVDLATKVREAEQTLGRTDNLVTELDVVALVRDRVADAHREHPAAEFALNAPNDAVTVRSSDLLGVAIDNLLENSVVHTDSSHPRVTVTVRRDDASGQSVEVAVADDGPGIPPTERRVLVDGEETPLEHGSGLGLWLVNWIVSESAGEISFGENEPCGSVVTLRLQTTDSEEAGAKATDGAG